MESHELSVPFELASVDNATKEDGTEVGRFSGLASTFGNVDKQGDTIAPGAFAGSIRSPKKIKMLWQHDPGEGPIGIWSHMEETDKGLAVEGQLLLEVPKGQQAHTLMKARALDSMSIGFMVGKGGQEFDDETGTRTLTKIDLWEISVVTFPANPKARIGTVKNYDGYASFKSKRELEAGLRDVFGFTGQQAKAIVAAGWQPKASDLRDGEDLDEIRELLKAQARKFKPGD